MSVDAQDRLLQAIVYATLVVSIIVLWFVLAGQHAWAETTLCAEAPGGKGIHWMWRMIDGRKCWFSGNELLPKSELRWKATAEETIRGQHPVDGGGSEDGSPPRSTPNVVDVGTRVVHEGMSNRSNWIDGAGGPIDLMRGNELQSAEMMGGRLVIPPYRDRAARMFDELEK